MSKKLIHICLAIGFCFASSIHAATIIWISDGYDDNGDGVIDDQPWMDLLETNGYTVDASFRNQEGRALDDDKIAALEAADLIIVSRNSNSGDYANNATEVTQWNSITTPLMLQAMHIIRNNRWLWVDSGSTTNLDSPMMEIVASNHKIFAGVTSPVDVLDETLGQTSFIDTSNVGNGELLAQTENGLLWIAEWETGVEFYPGAGQFAGGPRMMFVAGTQDVSGTTGRGMYNLTLEGEKLFLNTVRYLVGGAVEQAYSPEPEDGAMVNDTWISLGWLPGDLAVSHDVYLGDNFDDVNNATQDSELFRGNTTATFFIAGFTGNPYPDGLVPGTTYYWRIDEVNQADPNSPWKGNIWSFWIPSIKAYNPLPNDGSKFNDPADITLSWTAGIGAKLHYVHFGDNFDDVNDAAIGEPQGKTTFSPGPLELDKTYYWRVDEFDAATTHKGDVWSFSTLPDIQITDPNLVAWWKFDEGMGDRALDWSGNNNHGTIMGNPQWVAGYDGGALDFDGNGDYVFSSDVSLPTSAFTIAFWFNSETGLDSSSAREDFIYWQSVSRPHMTFNRSGNGEIGLWPNIDGDFDGPETMTSSWAAGTWYHIAGTFDGTNFRIHVNGTTERSVTHPGENAATTGLFIGCRSSLANNFNGMIDDVRIYNYALSDDEIKEAMRGDPLVAWGPKPANNSTPNIKDAVPLSWQSGNKTAQHDVYFGLDKNAVEDADASDTTGVYRIRQGATSYTPLEGVEWGGGPYYWRIDQFNTDGTISKGRIWSFTVADFILIDDFESYDTGDNQIWYAWHDGLGYGVPGIDPFFAGNGTGAAVGDETTASYTEEVIVHGGNQSMPYNYDNNKQGFARYSEAELMLSAVRNWTEGNVAELSLWFRGYPASVGSFVESPMGTYTITATGADIWNTADQFHYAFKTLTGAGSITAQVLSVDNTDPWAKAGVMIRETLGAGSKFAAVYITPGNGCSFQGRLDIDVAAVSDSAVRTTEQQAIVAPYWVKLERDFAGNFRASYSADGSNWTPMTWNPQNISMNTNVYVGLALTSHNNNATCEAQFSNVTITGNITGQWTNQDVGIASNDAEPLYVAISNSAGPPAVVVHNDPVAANIDTWTEWVIPLSAFADQGIILTDVDRIAIGLGTQGNMTIPGGKGKMYFDDIRLYQSR